MMSNRKKALMCLLAALLIAAFPFTALAGEAYERVYDYAQLFTQQQSQQINARINEFIENTGMDFVVLTSSDTGGRDSLDYADVFYDQNGFGSGEDFSGMVYFIDMDNRVPTISTCGGMIDVIDDSRLESLLDTAYDCLVEGEFAESALDVLDEAERYAQKGVADGQYRYDTQTGQQLTSKHRSLTLTEVLLALGVGTAVLFITRACLKSGYTIKNNVIHYDPYQNGAYNITQREDTFLRSDVVKHRRTPPPSSGGGSSGHVSSVHHSSTGSMHGGGSGRKF